MFGYLSGKIVDLTPTMTYIDINGVGYEVNITLTTYEAIQGKEQTKLYTYLQVREDAWVLYGFHSLQEKESFTKLLGVSGVGAATARILLSSISSQELAQIIENGDSKRLEKVKGIGGKTAQRIILELKGKLAIDAGQYDLTTTVHNTNQNDALNALLGLGISKTIAEAAIRKALPSLVDDYSIEDLIKAALKNL